MNSPYIGKFKVTQKFSSTHDGLDLVGIDSKNIYSTISGVVIHAGWENSFNHKQGFGQYVSIRKENTNERYYFGHLSEIFVKVGDVVKENDLIGVEGSTGYSTGSHCHYCCRVDGSRTPIDISNISGIPNQEFLIHNSEKQANKPINIVYKGIPLELSYLVKDQWHTFSDKIYAVMDGIKIRLKDENADFYLKYCTQNENNKFFYPSVKSTNDEFAGLSGKPVQRVLIEVYSKNGMLLNASVVVMYRAYVNGRWLPWVSNANANLMKKAQEIYHLGGALDSSSKHAGISGQNISGLEVYLFEKL